MHLLMMPVVSMTSVSMPTYRPISYTIYIRTSYDIVELHGNCLKYTSHLQTLKMFFFCVDHVHFGHKQCPVTLIQHERCSKNRHSAEIS